ncbi:serine/threonine-protein kinase [Microbacterium terricola]|nr:serine/threonine-protein kinase [Microbacterium terricola]
MNGVHVHGSERVGLVLDERYRLDAVLGDGAMATVYRAFDQELGRTVAVKLFRPGMTEAGDEHRRDSEKRLLASLNHPSLVTLFDARLSGGDHAYLVMEHIAGGTLTERLERGALPSSDAADLVAHLGEALHVVHAAGIIHRDIKPSNILLRPTSESGPALRAVLADFGIAYLVDTARVTTPGMAVGTAAYISPEQVRGAEPTPASDIYSLGLVLIESLTGRRAFPQQNSGEAIAARLSSPPAVPPGVSFAWRSLLVRMTAIDPLSRPTALEVARASRALEADDPAGPDVTQAAIEAAPHASAPSVDPPTAPTRLMPEAPAAVGHTTEALVAPTPVRRSARRRVVAVISAIAAAVVIAIAAFVWTGLGDPPATTPDLPEVQDPLGTHLDELLEQVTP